VTLIWNAESKKESWATRLKLKSEGGLHQEDHFTYLVRKGRFEPSVQEQSSSQVMTEILAYKSGQEEEVQAFSVTEILDKKSVGLKAELPDIQKAITGVDVHRIFESLKYKWMRDPNYQWQELMPTLAPLHQTALSYMAEDQDGLWLDIIRRGEVEFGMAVQFEGKLIQGQIDLWGEDSQGLIWIVDYKTGSTSYREKAFYQLQIYCWALQKIKKIEAHKTVNLAVIYPFSKMTLVRQAPSLVEIEKELRAVRD
jgi:ATP-dependent helicase/nuclease subunit A